MVLRSFTENLKPRWIWFEVTDRCNSRCTHCNIWRKKATEHPLTPEEIERVFKDPLFQKLDSIINSGGEAAIRNDIEEVLFAEHRALPQANLHLSTNGLLPERILEVVRAMAKNDIPIEIGVSIDGIGRKHDLIRGVEGNFAKADWLLRELVSMGNRYGGKIVPVIGFTLTDLTVDSFEEVRDYAEEIKADLVVQWYNESSFYDNVAKKLTDRIAKREKMIKIVKSLPPSLLNERWVNWLKGGSIKFQCFAMHTFVTLKCNGDFIPCLNFWETKAGNVREHTPTQIWHSWGAKKARTLVKNCQGCLNSWGVGWSAASSFYPNLFFHLRHRNILFEKLKRKFYRR